MCVASFRVLIIFVLGFYCGCDRDRDDAQPPVSAKEKLVLPPTSGLDVNLAIGLELPAKEVSFVGRGAYHAQASALLARARTGFLEPTNLSLALLKSAEQSTSRVWSKGVYLWSYRVILENQEYTVNLTGSEASNQLALTQGATWSLRWSTRAKRGDGCCMDFESLRGHTLSASRGKWEFYEYRARGQSEKILTMHYEIQDQGPKRIELIVENQRAGNAPLAKGSYLRYEAKGSAVRVLLRDSRDVDASTISWDVEDGSGSISNRQNGRLCWAGREQGYINTECESQDPT